MSACTLERIGVDQLVTGDLPRDLAVEVEAHLASECPTCDRILDRAGLDEDTLLMLLFAAQQPEPEAAQLDRVWQGVASALAEQQEREASNVVTFKPARRWFLSVASTAAVAAAAAVILVVMPRDPDVSSGLKGRADFEGATLVLAPSSALRDGDTVKLTYRLDRNAHVALLHWRGKEKGTLLFHGPVPAAPRGGGRFSMGRTYLGYRFENEPGRHLFVLLTSAERIEDAHADQLLDTEWLDQPESRAALAIGGKRVEAHAIRVDLEPGP